MNSDDLFFFDKHELLRYYREHARTVKQGYLWIADHQKKISADNHLYQICAWDPIKEETLIIIVRHNPLNGYAYHMYAVTPGWQDQPVIYARNF